MSFTIQLSFVKILPMKSLLKNSYHLVFKMICEILPHKKSK